MPMDERNWKIVARQGSEAYLIHIGDRIGTPDAQARVLDLDQKILSPPMSLHTAVSRGYWEEYKGRQDILPSLLARVRRIDSISEGAQDAA